MAESGCTTKERPIPEKAPRSGSIGRRARRNAVRDFRNRRFRRSAARRGRRTRRKAKKKPTWEAGSSRRRSRKVERSTEEESEGTSSSTSSDATMPIDVHMGPTLLNSHEDSLYDMTIIIFYGPQEVARHRVSSRHGCRLFYSSLSDGGDVLLPIGREAFEQLFGDLHRAQIVLPTPRPGKSGGVNVAKLLELLEAMERGLLLDVHAGDAFATMLGRCSVYCNDRRSATTPLGRLARDERTKVYDYDCRFVPSLRDFEAGRAGCPSTELYFTFGQTWNHGRPTEENLLSVAVVHETARRLVCDACRRRSNSNANSNSSEREIELEIIDPGDDDYFVDESE